MLTQNEALNPPRGAKLIVLQIKASLKQDDDEVVSLRTYTHYKRQRLKM